MHSTRSIFSADRPSGKRQEKERERERERVRERERDRERDREVEKRTEKSMRKAKGKKRNGKREEQETDKETAKREGEKKHEKQGARDRETTVGLLAVRPRAFCWSCFGAACFATRRQFEVLRVCAGKARYGKTTAPASLHRDGFSLWPRVLA